jgi:hypothetical protein
MGNLVYVATDINGLQVIDAANPALPVKIGAYESARSITKLEAVNNHIYAAAEDSGLRIIDVSNSKRPVIVGALNLPEEIMNIKGDYEKTFVAGVAVEGNQAFLAIRDIGIQVVDITNLSSLTESSFYPIPHGVADIAVVDNYIYISKGQGVNIPERRNGIEIINILPDGITEINAYIMPPSFGDVAVGDKYAYILGDKGLLTVDFSDPSIFTQVGFYDPKNSSGFLGLAVDNNYAYVATGDGLQIVGLSDTGIPAENLSLSLRGLRVVDIVMEDKIAYVATTSGLQVLDISNPLQPAIMGSYKTKTQVTYALTKERNLVYLSTQDEGILIIDISIPSNPIKVGNYVPPSEIENLAIRGRYAYIVTRNDGLRIIDIANPATPVEIGFMENLERVRDITIKGDYAYVPFRQGLAIIDITNPYKPSIVKQYDITGNIEKINLAGDYVYLSGGGDGLWIVDISNPNLSNKIYHYGGLYYETKGIDIQGDYTYVAADRLRILNTANPMALTEVGFYTEESLNPSDVAVSGNLAYIANLSGGLLVVDVTNPSKPVKIGSYELPVSALGVAVDGEYIYIAAGTDGMFIFQFTIPPSGGN